eukprot:gene26664-33278_t
MCIVKACMDMVCEHCASGQGSMFVEFDTFRYLEDIFRD